VVDHLGGVGATLRVLPPSGKLWVAARQADAEAVGVVVEAVHFSHSSASAIRDVPKLECVALARMSTMCLHESAAGQVHQMPLLLLCVAALKQLRKCPFPYPFTN
jgi:hypothetical protein